MDEESSMLSGLADDRGLLGRTSTAERVASVLRDRIMEGTLPPALRLSEEAIGRALGVSRNTLREAFRLLSHEHLLVHEMNRGVFVRKLGVADVIDLYHVRRLVEVAAVRACAPLDVSQARVLTAAVAAANKAAKEGRWHDVATANIHFHLAVAGLARSPRIDELMRHILAELRLAFHVMQDPREFHEPYLGRNGEMLMLLQAGETERAAQHLEEYLRDAEQEMLRQMRAEPVAAASS